MVILYASSKYNCGRNASAAVVTELSMPCHDKDASEQTQVPRNLDPTKRLGNKAVQPSTMAIVTTLTSAFQRMRSDHFHVWEEVLIN